ncbi:MAG TPA: class I SAM-dependent methyltransferase [Nitrospinaceae bacterium]|jgi:2-polyprenyl-3-methyl-5-hydroxy-6-metoxy-1,4-benzoquinol methylase|nr:class I SAM-dependent methyltransferase [Nitrospinaceae bacterium]
MYHKDYQQEYTVNKDYHHHLTGFRKLWFERNYILLTERVQGKVLDAACGDGRVLDFLQKEEVEIHGFDKSSKGLSLAEQKGGYKKLWLGEISAEENFLKDHYDFVICSLTLQHLSTASQLAHFDFMSKICKDKTEYRFSVPNNSHFLKPKIIKKILEKLFTRVSMKTIVGFIKNADHLKKDELQFQFSKAKLTSVENSYHYMIQVSNKI